jgi:DNA topoisomerase-6 subunit B
MAKKKSSKEITTSSTAEYFSKNLQQVGFSSPTKAVLTTLKEAVDNSLDACEDHGILPEIAVTIEKLGAGSLKNTDQILVRVEDNGPGIGAKDIAKVFGEYLASSKFGRGRCSRGQQGIGISAATTWAMQTTATGVVVATKMKGQKKAMRCKVQVDLKHNKGVILEKDEIAWDKPHGTSVEFLIDGRVQLNGEAGILSFLKGNILVNPHLTLRYKLPDEPEFVTDRVSEIVPEIPEATSPHPHTLKLGEFISYAKLFGAGSVSEWLKKGFSRMGDNAMSAVIQGLGSAKGILNKKVGELTEDEMKKLFAQIQNAPILPPSTRSVLSVGEEALAKSILRLGNVDFFAVVTRKPTICDFKPVQVEVAIARLEERIQDSEDAAQILRFANRVPLQFDKAGCAIVKAISTVNWKNYGLRQPTGQLPQGPYIFAVSVVSPFIKFKNASKETIESSDELVEEIRRALMQAGQRLSKHIRKESKEADLEEKIQHIEKFAPILVECLVNITNSGKQIKEDAEKGLLRILGRDTQAAKKELTEAQKNLLKHLEEKRRRLGEDVINIEDFEPRSGDDREEVDEIDAEEIAEEIAEEKRGKGKAKKAKAIKSSSKKEAKKSVKEEAKKGSKNVTKKSAKAPKAKPSGKAVPSKKAGKSKAASKSVKKKKGK